MDPMLDIENKKAQTDIGVFAVRVYEGARSEGATRRVAFMVLLAWFKGMFLANDEAMGDDLDG